MSSQTLYEEDRYTEKTKLKYPQYGLIVHLSLISFVGFLCILGGIYIFVDIGILDINYIVYTIIFIAAIIADYITGLRIYWHMYRSYNNLVRVTTEGVEVGKWSASVKEIERSVYNVSNGFLYIYLKNGKKFKICKDIAKISYFGGGTHFSAFEYGAALQKIGVPFEMVRKKGLFKTEPVKTMKDFKRLRHKERYRRWLERQKDINKNISRDKNE